MFNAEIDLTRSFDKHQVKDLKIAIVQARFNQHITTAIAEDCIAELLKQGVSSDNIQHEIVPGAAEIPYVLQSLIENYSYDALIAIGCVIRGETYHFELVANESAQGVLQVSLNYAVPIINSILTTENEQQALQRKATKGVVSAHDALEMALLAKKLYLQNV